MDQGDWEETQNGIQAQGELDPRRGITRPFALFEALPYSPQTSTVPFVPGWFSSVFACHANRHSNCFLDIIPDPSLGSGSPALNLSDVFPTQDFDKLNREAQDRPQLPKNAKNVVDMVLRDLKPADRTP